MPIVAALVARKGGSTKSTNVLNLAGAALDDGAKTVVIVDLDAQCSLSKSLLGADVVRNLRPDQTVQAVADRSRAAGDVVRETKTPGLLVVPGCPDLHVPPDAVLNLAGIDSPFVVCDTPPDTRDPAVRCALLSSHAVISPVVPEVWSMQSIPEVTSVLMSSGIVSNERLVFCGWLISMVQRFAMHQICEETIRRLHSTNVFSQVIPSAVIYKEASASGQPVSHYAPKSNAAKVARAVYSEFCERFQKHLEREAA